MPVPQRGFAGKRTRAAVNRNRWKGRVEVWVGRGFSLGAPGERSHEDGWLGGVQLRGAKLSGALGTHRPLFFLNQVCLCSYKERSPGPSSCRKS